MQQQQSMGHLQGKVCVVTGAATGIGQAIACEFAREGARVVVCYYNEHDEAKKTVEMCANCGAHAMALCGDIADEAFAKDAVDKVLESYGRLDVLVNNAGGQEKLCNKLSELSEKQLCRTFQNNVFGGLYMAKHAIPRMNNNGAIIFHSSCDAYTGRGNAIDYAAASGALLSLTYSLAANEEVRAKGIRVNCVASGNVMTPNAEHTMGKSLMETCAKETLLGRCAKPADIAPSFVFLASEQCCRHMTGHVIHPDGGVRLGS